MPTPLNYPSGLNLSGTVFANGPDTLQLDGGVYASGAIQWVDTINGDNANAGTRPELPVADLATAITNSAANGIIVIGEGSSETLSSSQAINKAGLMILGCGAGSTRPRYTCASNIDMWAVSSDAVWIEGFYFPASTTSAPTDRIGFAATNGVVKNCYFELGALDTNRAVRIHTGANSCRITGCSFVTTASRPATGLEISAAVSDTTVENNTFDGGSYGWSSYAFRVSAAATRTRLVGNTFTNMSDVSFESASNTYQAMGVDLGGTGNILITT